MRRLAFVAVVVAPLLVTACVYPSSLDKLAHDAGSQDAQPPLDAAQDSVADTVDAQLSDSGADGSVDSGADGSVDSGADGSVDSGADGSVDSGADGSVDSSVDAGPPIAFVQSNASDFGAGSSTGVVALTTTVTAHDTLIAAATFDNTSATLSFSDTLGSTFTSVVGPVDLVINSHRSYLFAAFDVAEGNDSITATITAPAQTEFEVYVQEYAGLSAFDVGKGATGTSTAMSSNAVSIAGSNELIFGYGWTTGQVTAAGTGFTTRSTTSGNLVEDLIATAPGSYQATATQNGSSWTMLVGAFKGY